MILYIFAGLTALFFFIIRDTFAFAAACLRTATAFIIEYPSSIVLAFVFLLVQVRQSHCWVHFELDLTSQFHDSTAFGRRFGI